MIDTVNPKDKIGKTKIPLALWPVSATIQGCMALFAGKTKYGRTNWRATPVYASIYFEALLRHGYKWWEGQDVDEDDGTTHLGNCLACLAILIDAKVCGTLIDDRQFNGSKVVSGFNAQAGLIPKLEDQYQHMKPKQYTIADSVPGSAGHEFVATAAAIIVAQTASDLIKVQSLTGLPTTGPAPGYGTATQAAINQEGRYIV
jgi:hypothetical protein